MIFLFTLLAAQKMKISKEWKKTPGDIILHKCAKNHDHIFYCSWHMSDVIVIFHFGKFLALWSPLPNSSKNENCAKIKKQLEVSSFNTSVPKIMIICFIVPEIWHLTDVIVSFHFGLFFALLPPSPLTSWKKMKKEKQTPGYIILHKYIKNHYHMLYCPWDMVPIKISKKWKEKKNAWKYHDFTHVHQKSWLDDLWFLIYGARHTEGRTEKVTYRGGCPT